VKDSWKEEPGMREADASGTSAAERKLITVVMADIDEIVDDFDDERDPEDVGGILQGHLDRVRSVIERYGGVVEHTLGGRAVGVFGIPRTRDDDPERAVRAALAIRDSIGGALQDAGDGRAPANEGLTGLWSDRSRQAGRRREPRVHLTVATGEALVSLGQPAEAGRRVNGDVMATCARLQEATPAGGVLVTEATMRATERTISYGPESIVALRAGDPVKVWSALEPRIRAGVGPGTIRHLPPLVAREEELAELLAGVARVRATGVPELVTIVGEPGIGKSRLAAELAHLVQSGAVADAPGDAVTPEPARWRHGRSLPYGGGAAFRALAEVVRAEAGIGESDSPERAEARLSDAVARAVKEPDAAAWVTGHLCRLIGIAPRGTADRAGGGVRQAGGPPREESLEASFAAWRRFLYGAAGRGTLVVILEELHWADDALLAFLLELTDPANAAQAGRVPLLVVGISRPELLERRPDWGADGHAARDDTDPGGTGARTSVLPLAPLSDADTTRLLEQLLTRHGLPGGVEPRLLDKVAGNPLFAEEYVRMVRDRELSALDAQSFGRSLPTTVRAIIAARLDALPPDEKAVLQDAAVLGQVGWVGALAALGGSARAELEDRLARLERKEFVHRVGRSRVAGEVEYAFRHVLVCDVAYAQIVRARRAAKHRLAAAWLEGLPAAGTEDRAELLVHHYQAAISFGTAAGQDVSDLTDRARFALRDAGDRAAALGAYGAAARWYGQALELWPRGGEGSADLLLRVGRARCQADGTGERELLAACQALLNAGDRVAAAEAVMLLGELAFLHGRGDERASHLNEALSLAKDAPPSRSKAAVLRGCMMHFVIANQHDQARMIAQEVVEMATALGLRDLEADAHGAIGVAKVDAGNPNGVEDLERCIAIYGELALPGVIAWRLNLAYCHAAAGNLEACWTSLHAAQEAADRFGSARQARSIRLQRVAEHYWAGSWDEAVRIVDALEAESGGEQDRHYLEWECRTWRGRIRLARGDVQAALDDAATALPPRQLHRRPPGDQPDPGVRHPGAARRRRGRRRGQAHRQAGRGPRRQHPQPGPRRRPRGRPARPRPQRRGGAGHPRGAAVALAGGRVGVRRRRPRPRRRAVPAHRLPARRGLRPPHRRPRADRRGLPGRGRGRAGPGGVVLPPGWRRPAPARGGSAVALTGLVGRGGHRTHGHARGAAPGKGRPSRPCGRLPPPVARVAEGHRPCDRLLGPLGAAQAGRGAQPQAGRVRRAGLTDEGGGVPQGGKELVVALALGQLERTVAGDVEGRDDPVALANGDRHRPQPGLQLALRDGVALGRDLLEHGPKLLGVDRGVGLGEPRLQVGGGEAGEQDPAAGGLLRRVARAGGQVDLEDAFERRRRDADGVLLVQDGRVGGEPGRGGDVADVRLDDAPDVERREARVAEPQRAWGEPPPGAAVRRRPGLGAQVAQLGQGQQVAAGGGAVDARALGDLDHGQRRLLRRERLQHLQAPQQHGASPSTSLIEPRSRPAPPGWRRPRFSNRLPVPAPARAVGGAPAQPDEGRCHRPPPPRPRLGSVCIPSAVDVLAASGQDATDRYQSTANGGGTNGGLTPATPLRRALSCAFMRAARPRC
jgi:hypothetical protein